MQEKRVVKKRRLNLKKVLAFFLVVYFITIAVINFINTPITNIYVLNNKFLSDQAIIDMVDISNYPSAFKTINVLLENKLKSSIYIVDANVYKKNFTELYIEVLENYPMFINKVSNQTVLKDGRSVTKTYTLPTLINYVPDTTYERFIKEMAKVNRDTLMHISEIEYKPNDVDDGRFLLAMTDGNYVYLTITDFDAINNYLDIVKNFGDKRGILYLDSGEYFEIIER